MFLIRYAFVGIAIVVLSLFSCTQPGKESLVDASASTIAQTQQNYINSFSRVEAAYQRLLEDPDNSSAQEEYYQEISKL